MIARRFGHWVHELRYEIKPLDERLRFNVNGDQVKQFYLIKDMFTIRDDDWSSAGEFGGTENWARERYRKEWHESFQHEEMGGLPHIFTRVETPGGFPIRNKTVIAWSDEHERIYDRNFDAYLDVEIEPLNGWGRFELDNASLYDPSLEQGPWCIKPMGFSESVEGIGLPRLMMGISSFIVWVEMPMDHFVQAASTTMAADASQAAMDSEFVRRISEVARLNQLIFFNPEATIQRQIIQDGFVPNSGEFEMPFGQARYVGQQAEHLRTGEVRVYFVKRNQWHRVQWLPVSKA